MTPFPQLSGWTRTVNCAAQAPLGDWSNGSGWRSPKPQVGVRFPGPPLDRRRHLRPRRRPARLRGGVAGRQARPGGGVGRRVEGRGLAGDARHERAGVVGLHARGAAGRPRPGRDRRRRRAAPARRLPGAAAAASITTTSSQRPSLRPTSRSMPTRSNPSDSCSRDRARSTHDPGKHGVEAVRRASRAARRAAACRCRGRGDAVDVDGVFDAGVVAGRSPHGDNEANPTTPPSSSSATSTAWAPLRAVSHSRWASSERGTRSKVTVEVVDLGL